MIMEEVKIEFSNLKSTYKKSIFTFHACVIMKKCSLQVAASQDQVRHQGDTTCNSIENLSVEYVWDTTVAHKAEYFPEKWK